MKVFGGFFVSVQRIVNSPSLSAKFLVLVFILLLLVTLKSTPSYEGYRMGELMCLDYLKDGVLYGGQPYCFHEIVYYAYGLFLSMVSMEYINELGLISNFVMDLVLLFLVLRVIRLEVKSDRYYYPVLLFIPSIFYTSLTGFGGPSLLASTLCFSAFYLLFYSKVGHKEIISGLLFALSAFTVFTVAPIILFILASIFLKSKKAVGRYLGRDNLTTVLTVVSVILIFSILIKLLFPHIFVYTILTHTYNYQGSLSDSIRSFILTPNPIPPQQVAIFLLALIGFIMLFQRLNIFSLISSLGFSVLLLSGLANFPIEILHYTAYFRFLMPALPFYIVSLAVYVKNLKNIFMKAFVLAALFFLVVYSSPVYQYLMPGRGQRAPEIIRAGYGVHFIPPQEGRVLMDGTSYEAESFISDYGIPIDMEQVDVVPPMFRMDVDYNRALAQALVDYGVVENMSELDEQTIEDYRIPGYYDEGLLYELTERFCSGEYGLVIDSPPTWFTVSKILEAPCSPVKEYCRVLLPIFEHTSHGGRHRVGLYFKDGGDCDKLSKDVYAYYNDNFEVLCNDSEFVVNTEVIRFLMFLDDKKIDRTCDSGNDFLERYQELQKKGNEFVRWFDILLTVLVFILSLLFLKMKGKPTQTHPSHTGD